jgi:hypothetical protein
MDGNKTEHVVNLTAQVREISSNQQREPTRPWNSPNSEPKAS